MNHTYLFKEVKWYGNAQRIFLVFVTQIALKLID